MAETETFEAAAYSATGTARERVTLPAETFDGTVNMPVMHQAVKAYLANQRQGNASTKTRAMVTGGGKKPWKQKGTGRARQGSTRAPHWVGGGTAFGPQPRDYDQKIPRKVKALARKSAFNARARENAIFVIDAFQMTAPKTAAIIQLLKALDVNGRKVLILTDGVKPEVFLSARNLTTVHVMPYSDTNTYNVLWSDVVLIESAALGNALTPAETAAPAAPRKAAAKKATAKTAATKSAATKPAAAKAPAKRAAAATPEVEGESAAPKKRATRKKAGDGSTPSDEEK